MQKISFIFPIYNEEKRIKNLHYFINWKKKKKIKNFEIILVSNGSTDGTNKIIKKLKQKFSFIKYLYIENKSRGEAINLAVKKSKFRLNTICAIDNAWDLNFYTIAYKKLKKNKLSIVFGPKSHEGSKVKRPIVRKIISAICSAFLKILFGNKIDQDTQCIRMFKKDHITFSKYLSKNNLFGDVEFYLYTKMFKLRYESISVKIKDNKKMVSFGMMIKFIINAISFRFSKQYNFAKYSAKSQ